MNPALAKPIAQTMLRAGLRRWIDLAEWRVRGPGVVLDLLEERSWAGSIGDSCRWAAMSGVDGEGRYEAAFFDAFVAQASAARVVVDAGAARGLYTLAAAKTGAGVIHAFEPSAARRFALRLNLLRSGCANRVHVRSETLGATSSEGAVTLDRYCQDAGIEPDLIKMDIEGAEIAMLEGARAVCLRARPTLLIEFHERRLRKHGKDPERLLELLAEYGYRVRFNGHHGALEGASRDADPEWRASRPNRNLTAVLAEPPL